MDRKYITLKNLMISGQKCIGLKFYQDKVLQALVNELPGVHWSEEFHMNYMPNSPAALDGIFDQFRGVAWVNCNHFFTNSGFSRNNEDINVDWFSKRNHPVAYRRCPESYLLKLELKADCPADNHERQLALFLYETLRVMPPKIQNES